MNLLKSGQINLSLSPAPGTPGGSQFVAHSMSECECGWVFTSIPNTWIKQEEGIPKHEEGRSMGDFNFVLCVFLYFPRFCSEHEFYFSSEKQSYECVHMLQRQKVIKIH